MDRLQQARNIVANECVNDAINFFLDDSFPQPHITFELKLEWLIDSLKQAKEIKNDTTITLSKLQDLTTTPLNFDRS